jgi:hypothetical protein
MLFLLIEFSIFTSHLLKHSYIKIADYILMNNNTTRVHLGRIFPSMSSSYVFKKSAALSDPDICKLTAAVPTAFKLIGSPVAVGTM